MHIMHICAPACLSSQKVPMCKIQVQHIFLLPPLGPAATVFVKVSSFLNFFSGYSWFPVTYSLPKAIRAGQIETNRIFQKRFIWIWMMLVSTVFFFIATELKLLLCMYVIVPEGSKLVAFPVALFSVIYGTRHQSSLNLLHENRSREAIPTEVLLLEWFPQIVSSSPTTSHSNIILHQSKTNLQVSIQAS